MSDMPPAAKRARSEDGAPTVAECENMVKYVSKEKAHALLAGLMAALPVVREIVEAEIYEPFDLSAYSRRAKSIVSSLYNVPPSMRFERCGEIRDKLGELVNECRDRLSSTDAFAAIVAILEVAGSEGDHEIRSALFDDESIDEQIAIELARLAEGMSSKEKKSISDAVDNLEDATEKVYYTDELEDIVTQMRAD